MNEDNWTEKLLKSIESLPHEVYKFTKLDARSADMFSEKSVLLIFYLDDKRRSRWLPFSQLRKDNNNNIWLATWLAEKLKKDLKNDWY
jgi:primosomal protein N''